MRVAEASGMRNLQLIDGVYISNMSELANWAVAADRVFTF